ncbi:hypothetical protein [Vitiosangium sp. GDMCC 1.1324]|uniref:hypothetical protein n=1 Tax=Vitiosangium sp. (strain GDMCC 1.1324) TaxID=2138576 RepID=UPI000D39E73E|nr:hypothetical protein [Vitiosangium sp. GDMCC 1.1324]PTL85825.1 hypothetical protein DAT35_03775 [Vitiosangium sp. GDMCC 1.1324]
MWTSSLMLGLLLTASAGTPGTSETPSGSATVPLQELLPLYAKHTEQTPPAPPTDALVVKSQLKGRLTADALVVDAHFEVQVLASGRWTQVRLLQLDAGTYLTELPTLDNATVGALEDQLSLVTREPGRYAFDVSLVLRSTGSGPERQVQLRFGSHVAPVPLRLEADAAAFTLTEPPASGGGDSEVYPRQGVLRIGWRTAVAPTLARQVVRPPMEPSIPEAQASWVSTLEGKATVRVRYALRLDREQELELELPEGHRLERVLLDSVPLVPSEKDGRLKLKVAPTRFGETQASLEVVLARELGVFHLSGRLKLALPRVSWPVATVQARAHFPAVFNYRREGGSMEEYETAEANDTLEGQTPLPGKVLHFRQYLVAASAPTLELGYSVDISKSYFR